MEEIQINPDAPDNWWVSPSGSDCWCTVGQLKILMKIAEEYNQLHHHMSEGGDFHEFASKQQLAP